MATIYCFPFTKLYTITLVDTSALYQSASFCPPPKSKMKVSLFSKKTEDPTSVCMLWLPVSD